MKYPPLSRHLLLASALVFPAPSFATQASSRPLPPGLAEAVAAAQDELGYDAVWRAGTPLPEAPEAWQASNPACGMRTYFTATGIRVTPRQEGALDWTFGLDLESWGRGGRWVAAEVPEIVTSGSSVEYRRGTLVEWYVNDERGLEQGFTLGSPPPVEATGELELALSVRGGFAAEIDADGRGAAFTGPNGAALTYAGLVAFDAERRDLPARLELREGRLVIRVDDRGARYPLTVDPQVVVTQVAKLVANNAGSNHYFGFAVALEGDTAVVGAYNWGTVGTAYVFERSAGAWTQVAQLSPLGGAGLDAIGYAVAVSGDTIAVGAHGDANANGNDAGSVYVYVRCGGLWIQAPAQPQLLASNGAALDYFGVSVDLDGDLMVVGAHAANATGTDSGEAYVFARLDSGTPTDPCDDTWCEQARLASLPAVPNNVLANDLFGRAVAIDGQTIVVGAYLDDSPLADAGSAHVFHLVDNANGDPCDDTWVAEAYLVEGFGAKVGDWFGLPVDISGDTILVGAYLDDTQAGDAGAAFVFDRLPGPIWVFNSQILAADATGTPNGAVSDHFATSVSLDGDFAVVGSPEVNLPGSNVGTAHVFKRSGANAWNHKALLRACDSASDDWFGTAVAIDGTTLLVGSPYDDDAGTYSGSAYVFEVLDIAGPPPFGVFALGDGSGGVDCPCAGPNNSTLDFGEGCLNSSGSHGAVLGPVGSSSVLADDLQLVGCNLGVGQAAIVFGSVNPLNGGIGNPLGAGLRGVGSPAKRFGVRSANATGMATWGPNLGAKGKWLAGQTWYFQVWYRDPSGPCATTNLSNGVSVSFSQ